MPIVHYSSLLLYHIASKYFLPKIESVKKFTASLSNSIHKENILQEQHMVSQTVLETYLDFWVYINEEKVF